MAQQPDAVSWKVDSVAGEEVVESTKDVVINLGRDGTVNGNAGCNNFMGRYVTNGDAILMSPLAATMMMCPDGAMEQERKVFGALEGARTFTETETAMELMDAEGTVVMTLTKISAPE